MNSGIANYTISGGAPSHVLANLIGTVRIQLVTITLTGTPAFAPFVSALRNSSVFINANTFSGAATGSRFTIDREALIFVNGSGFNYLPGDAAGTLLRGGSYDGIFAQPVSSQSAAYTTTEADTNQTLLHPSADTTARTFTIDSNANVPYPVGSTITFVNQHSAGTLTIAITTDTMRLSPGGTTGSRTLAADGIAIARKITSTEWIISGSGLT